MLRSLSSTLRAHKPMLVALSAITLLSACSSTDEVSEDENITIYERSMEEGYQPPGMGDNIYGESLDGPAAGTQSDLVVNIGDRVFFGYDRYDLSPEARSILDSQAKWLQQYPNVTVTIEGHADERGTREYNLALGDRRATSTKNYLIALGVDPRRISTISYGKERPAVPGSTDAAWSQNRRTVTKVD